LPIYAGADVAVHRDVTVGGTAFVSTSGASFGLLGRADYHWNRLFDVPREFDIYLGGGVLFEGTGLYPRLHLGGRWFWTERLGLNLELGGALRDARALLGLTVKIN